MVTDFFRTSLNSTASPLLRLPAELRNQIWHLAFGEKILHVNVGRIPTETEEQPQLDYTLFDSNGRSYEHTTPNSDWSLPGAPQTVCRQYWAEASQAFFSSCALMIDEPAAFRCFVQSGEPIVSQIRRLLVFVCDKKSHNFPMYWQDVFNSTLVGRLTSLEGVKFSGVVYWGPHQNSTKTDVMSGYHWKMIKMPGTIRSFQQHKLKEELTTVDFQPEDPTDGRASAIGPINEAIRENLLRHYPRRLSKRKV
jgi:hypothetical protein